MASSDGSSSFEAMIHADRARKKNEDLANQIFGRSKSSQNVKKSQKEQPRSPSLASRMGVQKRHSSTSTPTQKNPFNPPSRPSSTTPSHRNSNNASQANARANRIASEIDSGNANIATTTSFRGNPPTKPNRNGTEPSQVTGQPGPGLTIKGSAGPFTLHASNFDRGTTEADIEAALHRHLFDEAGKNCLLSCRLVSTRPAVVAEMVFSEKSVADRIISKFDNLKADGRILKVEYVKSSQIPDNTARRSATVPSGVAQSIEPVTAADDVNPNAGEGDVDMDEVEITTEFPATTPYDHEREAADRDRRDRDRTRDEFGTGSRREDRRDDRPRDDRDRRRDDRDRDRDRERRDEDRDRERDRDRDRERDHDRDRERDYERRDSQTFSQPQPQPQTQPYDSGYSQRPPAPPYGNGYNRPPRGGYGGYGGRGYGFSRGGYGPRGGGGYRGSYGR